ncbi:MULTISPECIES: ferredoxin family protein [unclassified Ensifer]|uniref:4Fe-4S dicluster domain-containing protein n=1 Tax=unclassified Ensifer TaxID=2633371 RepID=UPI00070F3A49|nr:MULTISPECIES: ferredoxin family protein [unclassified Ensifer]MDP9634963.1 NAD-dependent dihydropyrimidine dehydrogenase PreA subunit [Ensifer adhaerens]KQU87872.1 4Fe-4S ferredoxin [Ensifer sp. Root31]KQW72754.1 4Fe-4S ferredoxin [Ensifer sp. Root127]OMQ43223.1 4Fe-4S ferredoxin [Ensifer sp. 1H6]PSS65017.1 ferredoxin family protein [Ensifer sp. NM-2]
MIEVLDSDTCTDCNLCVQVCPTNVFQVMPYGPPRILRQEACQTCFMCELYCPVDALYVDPDAEAVHGLTVDVVRKSNLFGSYRRAIGWHKDTRHQRHIDDHYRLPQ